MVLPIEDMAPVMVQRWLQSAIVPRPIGLISTIDRDGNVNLAPFSFFNLFSSNPPVIIFSVARRARDNTTKHSLDNLYEVPEVVVHMINEQLLPQAIIASADYPKDQNEFQKAGFTAIKAAKVLPPMVKECPVRMEAMVKEIKPLGRAGGAGNLVIAELVCLHIDEKIMNQSRTEIDPLLLQPVARLGGEWYSRVNVSSLFMFEKPGSELPVGMDKLPSSIRRSRVLESRHLARLASVVAIPDLQPENNPFLELVDPESDPLELRYTAHQMAKIYVENGQLSEAWQILLAELSYYENGV